MLLHLLLPHYMAWMCKELKLSRPHIHLQQMFLLILTLLDKQILSKGEWKMIKFKGELSRECKKYMRLRDSLVGVIAAAIGGAVLAAPIILFVCSFFPPVAGVIVYILCWLAVVVG